MARVRRRVRREQAPRAQRQERRERLAMNLPLMLAVLVAAEAVAGALSATVNEPRYEFCLHAMIAAAVGLSLLGAVTRRSFSVPGIVIMVLAFVAYALRRGVEMPLTTLFYPLEVAADDETFLAALAAWFLVGFCFMQSQRENLVFIFVPGLTVFALMATRNPNIGLFVIFLVFLLASIFAWGYEHFLTAAGDQRPKLRWWDWARHHLSTASLVFAIAAFGGFAIGTALDYTMPQMYAGFGLQQRIWNSTGLQTQGYFLFRPGFELTGGQIRLSQDPMLKVRADEAVKWRGRAYDLYTGQGWSRSMEATRRTQRLGERSFDVRALAPERSVITGGPMPAPMLWMQPGGPGGEAPQVPAGGKGMPGPGAMMGSGMPGAGGVPGSGGPSGSPPVYGNPGMGQPTQRRELSDEDYEIGPLKGRDLKQQIEVMTTSTAGIFVATHAYRVEFGESSGYLDVARSTGLNTDPFGSLQTGAVMQPGQTYTVWSKLPEFRPDDLRSAGDNYSARMRELYIDQNTADVVAGLGDLVAQITAGQTNPYDKAVAIQRWLEENCLYTLNVPYAPANKDPVVHFVTRSRRGACDLFSSSLTLMCRVAGVPARVTVGFAPGAYDRDEDAIIVRGTDAHAWTEIFFPGHGWVPFDPVAQRQEARESLLSLLRSGHWQFATGKLARDIFLGILLLIGLYLAATALVDPRPYLRALTDRLRPRDAMAALATEYGLLMRATACAAGLRLRPSRTPRELVELTSVQARLGAAGDLHDELRELAREFYALRYGRAVRPEQLLQLRARVRAARQRLRKAPLPAPAA